MAINKIRKGEVPRNSCGRSDDTVPVFTTSGTSKMMLAAAVFAAQKQLDRTRFQEVVSQQPIQIGDCKVTPLAVDHSIFGSVAFLIEAEGKTILYSGDFRNHGRKPGMIRDLLNHLKAKTVDVLIVEGTHFGSEKEQGHTEFRPSMVEFDFNGQLPSRCRVLYGYPV